MKLIVILLFLALVACKSWMGWNESDSDDFQGKLTSAASFALFFGLPQIICLLVVTSKSMTPRRAVDAGWATVIFALTAWYFGTLPGGKPPSWGGEASFDVPVMFVAELFVAVAFAMKYPRLSPHEEEANGMKLHLAVWVGVLVLGFVALVPDYTFTTPEDFRRACKDTRVRFYKPPSAPVTSVLWEKHPQGAPDISFHGYVISGNKRLESAGTTSGSWQPFLKDHVPVYSPVPQSYEQRKKGIAASGFHRTYQREAGQVAGPASFDVKVTHTISPDSSLQRAGMWMRLARHAVEVTDLRTNERLAEMVYVIDRKRNLACGENIPGQANMDVFVLQATQLIQNVVQPASHKRPWVAPQTPYER